MKIEQLVLGTFFTAFVWTPMVIAAQNASGQAQPGSVTLDVVVTDKSGKPVRGLEAQDFKVLDNKEPHSIMSFHAVEGASVDADPPVEAILLVDMINTEFGTLADERRNITEYLRQKGGHLALPTSFIFLTDQGLKFQEQPTHDPNVLLANLENNPTSQRAFPQTEGFQAYIQMREKSLQALDGLAVKLSQKPGRKVVIWISPGWQAFSGASNQKSAKEWQDLFNFIAGISTELRQARITLYSVDPRGANQIQGINTDFTYKDFLKGVASPKQADNGDLLLQVIAAQTGGQVVFGSNNTARMIDQCLVDAEAYYVLTFNSPSADRANEYHGIQVQVDKPGLKVRTLTGYYAQP
jgi:VWFA-related protein